MSNEVLEQVRNAAKRTGQVLFGILEVFVKVAEEYQNAPAPCHGCRQTFQRKTMTRLWDIPQYAQHWWVVFCDDCAERLRTAYRYEGILRNENRKLLAQLKRAIDKDLPATLTLSEWVATLNHFGWHCAYCLDGPYEAIEHCVPIERGGGTAADNCVPACKSCNSQKGVRHPDEIRQSSRDPAAVARVRLYLATQRRLKPPPELSTPASSTGILPEFPDPASLPNQ